MNEARQLAMKKLRPVLEPRLKEWGLEFEDVIPALEQVDRIEDLQGALTNPSDQALQPSDHVVTRLCQTLCVPKLEFQTLKQCVRHFLCQK